MKQFFACWKSQSLDKCFVMVRLPKDIKCCKTLWAKSNKVIQPNLEGWNIGTKTSKYNKALKYPASKCSDLTFFKTSIFKGLYFLEWRPILTSSPCSQCAPHTNFTQFYMNKIQIFCGFYVDFIKLTQCCFQMFVFSKQKLWNQRPCCSKICWTPNFGSN